MHTPRLDKKRRQLDVLIENKVTFAADNSELSIYDTYESAQKVALHSDELLFCAMWIVVSITTLFYLTSLLSLHQNRRC